MYSPDCMGYFVYILTQFFYTSEGLSREHLSHFPTAQASLAHFFSLFCLFVYVLVLLLLSTCLQIFLSIKIVKCFVCTVKKAEFEKGRRKIRKEQFPDRCFLIFPRFLV